MKSRIIKKIINKHLDNWVDKELNILPTTIESDMVDPLHMPDTWNKWLPVECQISDDELNSLEKTIGAPLPEDYKTFLKHKHFYELHIDEAIFYKHPKSTWKDCLSRMMLQKYPPQHLINKGYIPFVKWSDWGVLCFDTNRNYNTDYPIVLWESEIPDIYHRAYENFFEFLTTVDNNTFQSINDK
jgi:hypothetical protein